MVTGNPTFSNFLIDVCGFVCCYENCATLT